MTSWLAELRRRRVFRTAAWYGAAAWLLIQVASTVAPAWGLPEWTVRVVIGAALLGLPVVLLLAWAFDLTPRGIERTAATVPDAVTGGGSHPLLSLLLALAAGVLLGVGALQGWRSLDAPAERPGIAVLAFDVLGEEANRAFAGGLHEAVLNELAGISGLRVIARSSVLRFADEKADLREVGRILDVPWVIEGSVLRDGGKLRVHAQLIEAASNAHVWSQTYDRAADDIFGVQTALAKDIAAKLRVTLLPAELARASAAPTADPMAYDVYLRASADLTLYWSREQQRETLERAIAGFDAALARDPAFALAYAERGRARVMLWWVHRDELSEDPRIAALEDIETALRLVPGLGESRRARGMYYYYGHLDYARADAELSAARALLPNDAETVVLLASLKRRQGRFDESVELFLEAATLDPNRGGTLGVALYELYLARRFVVAERIADDWMARFPERGQPYRIKALLGFCRSGDATGLRSAPLHGSLRRGGEYLHWLGHMLDGRYAEALALLEDVEDDEIGMESAAILLADTRLQLGDAAGAAAAVAADLREAEAAIAESPDALGRWIELAQMYAFANRPHDVRRVIRAQLALVPPERSAMDHWELRREAAEALSRIGDREAAFEQLAAIQEGPRGYCGHFLRRWPAFASLRGDPRLEKLARQGDWPGRP